MQIYLKFRLFFIRRANDFFLVARCECKKFTFVSAEWKQNKNAERFIAMKEQQPWVGKTQNSFTTNWTWRIMMTPHEYLGFIWKEIFLAGIGHRMYFPGNHYKKAFNGISMIWENWKLSIEVLLWIILFSSHSLTFHLM